MVQTQHARVAANDTNKSNPMLTKKKHLPWLRIGLLGLVSSAQLASAQYFTNAGFGDLIAGFRKTGVNAGNYELMANIGNVSNLLALSPGPTINIPNITTAVLSDTFPNGNANIQWSVFSSFKTATLTWTTSFGVFPSSTVWYTVSSGTNTTTQTTPPGRNSPAAARAFWNHACGRAPSTRKAFPAGLR